MRARGWFWSLGAILAIAAPLAYLAQAGEVSKVSEFGYEVDTGGVRMVADVEAARYKGKAKYIPIVMLIGARGTATLNLDRSSFTLTDPAGQTHPLATVAEIQDKKNYGNFNVADDYTYIAKTVEAGPARAAFTGLGFQQGTAFYVNVGKGFPKMLRDQVQLRPNAFTWALLYFANPGGKASGTYTLTFDDPKNNLKVQLPFTISWK
jgi:hypothetical protein